MFIGFYFIASVNNVSNQIVENKIMQLFITNKDHYYFIVEGYPEIESSLPKGCVRHNTIGDMYLFVAQKLGLELDEVEGHEFLIKAGKFWDDRGFGQDISVDVDVFIKDFVL